VDAIRQQNRPWRVEILNLDDVLSTRSIAWPAYAIASFTTGPCAVPGPSVRTVDLRHARLLQGWQIKLLREQWRKLRSDLVISTIPPFNRALFKSLRAKAPNTPLVIVVTDLADYPPHFCFEPQEQHFICGSELA
jgi:hypothetical protein